MYLILTDALSSTDIDEWTVNRINCKIKVSVQFVTSKTVLVHQSFTVMFHPTQNNGHPVRKHTHTNSVIAIYPNVEHCVGGCEF